MDERTSRTNAALDEKSKAHDTSNLAAGSALWCILLLGALTVGLFGSYAWTWVGIGVLMLSTSVFVIAGSRRSEVRAFYEDCFLKLTRTPSQWPSNEVGRHSRVRTLLALRNVRKSYKSANGEVTEVLKELDLSIEGGSFNVIRGESGSGKTSLLKLMAGLLRPQTGRITLGDKDIAKLTPRALARSTAVVPQENPVLFPFTVGEFVGGPLMIVIVVVLLVRPAGLFGRAVVRRV